MVFVNSTTITTYYIALKVIQNNLFNCCPPGKNSESQPPKRVTLHHDIASSHTTIETIEFAMDHSRPNDFFIPHRKVEMK